MYFWAEKHFMNALMIIWSYCKGCLFFLFSFDLTLEWCTTHPFGVFSVPYMNKIVQIKFLLVIWLFILETAHLDIYLDLWLWPSFLFFGPRTSNKQTLGLFHLCLPVTYAYQISYFKCITGIKQISYGVFVSLPSKLHYTLWGHSEQFCKIFVSLSFMVTEEISPQWKNCFERCLLKDKVFD